MEKKDNANEKSRDGLPPRSIAAAIRNLYESSDLSDVEIEGSDGRKLSAHRNILASRSQVFKQLLAGQFSEAKSPVVNIGFDGDVLKVVLEYCYTDEANFTCEDETTVSEEESMVQMAMEVVSAADYFALPGLCDKVFDWVAAQMEKNPILIWTVLCQAEFTERADAWSARARAVMMEHAEEACLSIGKDRLGQMSRWALEQAVSDNNMAVKESSLFRLIDSWANVVDSKKRKADAAGLVAKYIHLDRIAASDVVAILKPSDLVTKRQLFDVIESLATRAEAAGVSSSGMRGACWETTQSDYLSPSTHNATTLLECVPMKTGKHMWSIEVIRKSDNWIMWLGLACSSGMIDKTESLGRQQHIWAYGSDGRSRHASEYTAAAPSSFDEGDIVTFTLDLSTPISLKARVNDGVENTIFNHGELTRDGRDSTYSFVPAVCLKAQSAVRFRGFLTA